MRSQVKRYNGVSTVLAAASEVPCLPVVLFIDQSGPGLSALHGEISHGRAGVLTFWLPLFVTSQMKESPPLTFFIYGTRTPSRAVALKLAVHGGKRGLCYLADVSLIFLYVSHFYETNITQLL